MKEHDPSDFSRTYRVLKDAQHFQVAQDEQTWTDRYIEADRSVPFVLNFGCGAQITPHIMLDTVGVLTALGLDFVAVAGPQWCCGVPYNSAGEPASGLNMVRNSVKRMAAFKPLETVHWCGAWWPQVKAAIPAGEEPFGLTHVTEFLARTLTERANTIPWRKEVRGNALLHLKSREGTGNAPGNRATPFAAMEANVPIALSVIPGLRVVGDAPGLTGLGSCSFPDDATTPDDAGPEATERTRAELVDRARELGGDLVITSHQACHRVWGKYSTPQVPVRHFISLLAEGLGIGRPDRYHEYWDARDHNAIVERARHSWESWGVTEPEARAIAGRLFPGS